MDRVISCHIVLTMQHLLLAVRHYPSSFSCVTVLHNRLIKIYIIIEIDKAFHESMEEKKIGFTTKHKDAIGWLLKYFLKNMLESCL